MKKCNEKSYFSAWSEHSTEASCYIVWVFARWVHSMQIWKSAESAFFGREGFKTIWQLEDLYECVFMDIIDYLWVKKNW